MSPLILAALLYCVSLVEFRAAACVITTKAPEPVGDTRRIGAFNIRVFGPSKASNDEVMTELVTVSI